ncbi:MAG: M15 family metallopeptidase [bacterium]
MPEFSQKSAKKLATCHKDLVMLFSQVIKYYDFTVLHGHRTPQEQYELYQKGRDKEGDIVTYKDGYENKSKHNYKPSLAVDVITYHSEKPHFRWDNKDEHQFLGGLVMGVYYRLKREGLIKNEIEWGGNWENFYDPFHFQIKG